MCSDMNLENRVIIRKYFYLSCSCENLTDDIGLERKDAAFKIMEFTSSEV
jgi:hypothetical protein